jgi:glycosyltransferase involved in cell wall biosynthesis
MQSIAISVVRNCQDIIGLTVLHHVLLGVDRCIVVDNGSTDGTSERLQAIAKKLPQVEVLSDPSDFHQAVQSAAVANAYSRGKQTLVIQFDADEFWLAPVKSVLRHMVNHNVNVLSCPVVNFVQRRSIDKPTCFSWSSAMRRVDYPEPYDAESVRTRRCAFIELAYPRKVIWRADGEVVLAKGAHHVDFAGKREGACEAVAALHLPLRSKLELTKRAYDYAPRFLADRVGPDDSWQSEYFRNEVLRGEAEAQWRANSYSEAGTLDVFGRPKPTIVDRRLVRRLWRAYAYGLYLGIPLHMPAVRQPAQRHWHQRASSPRREPALQQPQIGRLKGGRRPLR